MRLFLLMLGFVLLPLTASAASPDEAETVLEEPNTDTVEVISGSFEAVDGAEPIMTAIDTDDQIANSDADALPSSVQIPLDQKLFFWVFIALVIAGGFAAKGKRKKIGSGGYSSKDGVHVNVQGSGNKK